MGTLYLSSPRQCTQWGSLVQIQGSFAVKWGYFMGIYQHSCTCTVHIHTIIEKIRIYTYHTRVYMYIYINISLDEEIPGSMYLLPQVGFPTVVVGRGVDV